MKVAGLASDVFLEEHQGRFLLHAPLLEISCRANRKLAEDLRRASEIRRLPDDAVLAELERHGLLAAAPVQPAPSVDVLPSEITLAVTGRCTLRCRYCYTNGGEQSGPLAVELASFALEQTARNAALSKKPSMTVHLHGGGEPTADWHHMRRIIDEAEEIALREGLGLRLTAGLNGVLSAEQAKTATRLFDEVTVSLDGGKEVHDRQRPTPEGRGSWHSVIRTLAVFDDEGLAYGIRMTVTDDSLEELPDSVAAVCTSCQAQAIQAEPVSPLGRGRRARGVTAERFVDAFRRAKVVAADHGRGLRTSGARFPQVTDVFCRAVTGALCVKPSGRVVACYEAADGDGPFSVGHVSPENRGMALDEGRRKDLLRLAVDNVPHCSNCVARYHCAGDCPMKRLHRGAGERCKANRLLTLDQILARLPGDDGLSTEV